MRPRFGAEVSLSKQDLVLLGFGDSFESEVQDSKHFHSGIKPPNGILTNNMKIRSVTYFTNPGWPIQKRVLQSAANFIREARPAFEAAGFEVQTCRLATPPFSTLLPDVTPDVVTGFAQALEAEISNMGFEYLSIGPAQPEVPGSYAAIPEVIARTENTFASGVMSSQATGVSIPAVKACAEIIQALGPQDPKGFANLYFAALGNVSHGSPFFPAAYHDGERPTFAIATEAADLAVTAFRSSETLQDARDKLRAAMEEQGRKILKVADSLGIRFWGIDYSLAPFPKASSSLGTAMEHLTGTRVGSHSSLAAAALIADTIDKAIFPHTGFSGLMLPVLEDAILAKRAAEGSLTIKDLLLYSAVCGTGLDTVPLPGDATAAQLTAVLLDLASMALRLDKPLTARLMPIPGKGVGDPTDFDFPFFANSRVMALETGTMTGLLNAEDQFDLGTRKS
jgi:uncharacterized protein (UPF0210 family)